MALNLGELFATIGADVSGLLKAQTDAEEALQGINDHFEMAGKAAEVFGAALAAIGIGFSLKEIIGEVSAAERSFSQLEAGVRSTGGACGYTAEQLRGLAEGFQQASTSSHVLIENAEGVLLTFADIGHDAFPQATQAVMDLAARMGIEAPQAALQLGKALNDPILGLTALRREGVQFNASQKETIQIMMDLGEKAGAQKVILDELEKEFGGSAAAARDTFGGALAALKNSFKDLMEGPQSLNAAKEGVEDLIKVLQQKDVIGVFSDAVELLAKSIGILAKGLAGTISLLKEAGSLPVAMQHGIVQEAIAKKPGPMDNEENPMDTGNDFAKYSAAHQSQMKANVNIEDINKLASAHKQAAAATQDHTQASNALADSMQDLIDKQKTANQYLQMELDGNKAAIPVAQARAKVQQDLATENARLAILKSATSPDQNAIDKEKALIAQKESEGQLYIAAVQHEQDLKQAIGDRQAAQRAADEANVQSLKDAQTFLEQNARLEQQAGKAIAELGDSLTEDSQKYDAFLQKMQQQNAILAQGVSIRGQDLAVQKAIAELSEKMGRPAAPDEIAAISPLAVQGYNQAQANKLQQQEISKGVEMANQLQTAQQKLVQEQTDLTQAWNAGKISLQQYNQAMSEAQMKSTQTGSYMLELQKQVGTLSQAMDTLTAGALKSFETSLSSGMMTAFNDAITGSKNFSKDMQQVFVGLGQAIEKEIFDMIAKMMLIKSMQAIGGMMGGGSSATLLAGSFTAQAQGGAFGDSGLIHAYAAGGIIKGGLEGWGAGDHLKGESEYHRRAFAQGGIVGSPTMFQFAGGTGLMGEAGPEAIMPLKRTSRGDLGVALTSDGSNAQRNQPVQVSHETHIYNMLSPNDILGVVGSEEGKQVVVNHVVSDNAQRGSVYKAITSGRASQ